MRSDEIRTARVLFITNSQIKMLKKQTFRIFEPTVFSFGFLSNTILFALGHLLIFLCSYIKRWNFNKKIKINQDKIELNRKELIAKYCLFFKRTVGMLDMA